ncbi:hypothetical protein K1719_032209 [Acacia pycnantha]|nr:hypothetical protein K1719_032209 [Acacia pycnantha]
MFNHSQPHNICFRSSSSPSVWPLVPSCSLTSSSQSLFASVSLPNSPLKALLILAVRIPCRNHLISLSTFFFLSLTHAHLSHFLCAKFDRQFREQSTQI